MSFFSVVIPLYNKQAFVAQTLESVLTQTFQDFEILVVDDCSTDGGKDVVRQFTDTRIKLISHETNKGLSAARNTGIKSSQADYIAFIDADDRWKPQFLQKIDEMTRLFPDAGIFATAYEEVHPGNISVAIHKNVDINNGEMAIINDFFLAASKQPILWYGSAVVKKEVFGKVGDFDETITWYEDVDFNIRANLHYNLAYYNSSCALYTIASQNQITRTNIDSRVVCNLSEYEKYTASRPSLKLFLDINRYALAMEYKLAGNTSAFEEHSSAINPASLTKPQKILLGLAPGAARLIRNFKLFLLRHGIRLTTFSS
ncbi:MAG TPA: glycosyltransferase family 2 protein [Flavobacterium sp.]|jgi:glycosyltransferase involved in cell wall biosynthesis